MDEQVAFDIACGTRILASEGLSTLVAGHLSVDVGGEMYVNRFGPSFAQVRPEDIIRVDYDGNVVEGEGYTNDTIRLHGVLHRMVPEARALVHTHPPSVVTLSSFRLVPEIYDQESCFLAGDIAIYDENYEGLVTTEERVSPMASVLRKARNLILPNHGALTSGDNIRVATLRMTLLEHLAKRYLAVRQTAATLDRKPKGIPEEVAIGTRKELEGLKAEGLVWQDYISRLGLAKPGGFD
jgi:ribulose-5-phosphate 4-epimerase/fuculose-1-phosphate aldolase